MPLIDLESLLQPVSESLPCGSDPEYEADFREALRLSEAVPAKWEKGLSLVHALWLKHRDLRLAVLFVRANWALEHWQGLKGSLELVLGLLRLHWDHVHPMLDADGDNDPTSRANALAALNHPRALIAELRNKPIIQAERIGQFSYWDILDARRIAQEAAKRKLPGQEEEYAPKPGDEDKASFETIEQAFQATEDARWQEVIETIAQSESIVKEIEIIFQERVGQSRSISMSLLSETLETTRKLLEEQLPNAIETSSVKEVSEGISESEGLKHAVRPKANPVKVHSRAEVIPAIESICKFYKSHEPSSPIPLVLRRAKRLVERDFLEIIQDLMPDAVGQLSEWQINPTNDQIASEDHAQVTTPAISSKAIEEIPKTIRAELPEIDHQDVAGDSVNAWSSDETSAVSDNVQETGGSIDTAPASQQPSLTEAEKQTNENKKGAFPIRSLQEMSNTLRAICEYYDTNEPSSPLIILLKRAESLVDVGFVEIIQNLMPDSVRQAERWRGPASV